ncbi:phospholipase-like protein [Tanacetum coccineum]
MERYNQTFKCTCERGDVVLRTSRKDYSYGRQYYACPYSKPGTEDRGCGYFMWMDDLRLHISSSSGSLTPPSIFSGTFKHVQLFSPDLPDLYDLERQCAQIKHTLDSAAILHELYNDMGKLGLE